MRLRKKKEVGSLNNAYDCQNQSVIKLTQSPQIRQSAYDFL
jgi:hypothetical protein